jgi:transposase
MAWYSSAEAAASCAMIRYPTPWSSKYSRSCSATEVISARGVNEGRLIDELDREIDNCESELRRLGADHRYVPLLLTVPGIGWVLAYTIAAEVGDIARFGSPRKLAGYTGLCPRVYQSGESDRRGPLAKQGPKYLRWALVEAAVHASTHPAYRDRYQRTKTRVGKQRGAKVAQVDLARKLAEAIWHMLTRNQPFRSGRRHRPLAA